MERIHTINHAINYIETRLREPLTVEAVARAAGYSRFHFERCFLAEVGQTPAVYLRKRRLTEAARELVDSTRPIMDILLDYQFQSQEAFIRAFKKEFRLTPLVYRRRGRFVGGYQRVLLRATRLARPSLLETLLFVLNPRGRFGFEG